MGLEVIVVKRLSIISIIVVLLTSIFSGANASDVYTLVNANGQPTSGAVLVCGDDVCGPNGSFSTNSQIMSQIANSYNCSPTPCRFVAGYLYPQAPNPSPTPTASPTPTPTPTTSSIETVTVTQPNPATTTSTTSTTTNSSTLTTCVGGSERVQGLPQCLMPENLPGSTWNEVSNTTGIVINGAVCSAAVCGRNGEFRNMKNANGKSTPNGYPENSTYIQAPTNGAAWGRYFINGVYETANGEIYQPGSLTPTRNVVASLETKTVTIQVDTKTVSNISETITTTTKTESKKDVSNGTNQSDTRTAAVILISTISNIESRTVTAANLLSSYSVAEKEAALSVVVKSTKSATINISTDVPEIKMVVTATKIGAKPVSFNVQTNNVGDASLKTTMNLTGYTVTLSVGKVKIDSDLVRKQT